MKTKLIIAALLIISQTINAQHRPMDIIPKEEKLGVTAMGKYMYKDWDKGSSTKFGEFQFDHFRIWARTDIGEKFFASVQYRFYEGWRTPQHLFFGFKFDNNTIKVGQTWVPFGIGWQTFDDWGNIVYYVGLQDDYDYGATWTYELNQFSFDFGFFKNQQLSSSNRGRYDPDIFSGSIGSDDTIPLQKANSETNQFNFRVVYSLPVKTFNLNFGASVLYGQIYNSDVNDCGTRLAYEIHSEFQYKVFHLNLQGTFYDYDQKLPDGSTQDDYNFINVASWNFAYEIPRKARIISSSASVDIIGDKLGGYVNYSYLWGGTSEASSSIFTTGVRSLWNSFEAFLELYNGVNDPQFSGIASGYGRNAKSNEVRVDLRLYYKLSIVGNGLVK
jgi:hypothetical protein